MAVLRWAARAEEPRFSAAEIIQSHQEPRFARDTSGRRGAPRQDGDSSAAREAVDAPGNQPSRGQQKTRPSSQQLSKSSNATPNDSQEQRRPPSPPNEETPIRSEEEQSRGGNGQSHSSNQGGSSFRTDDGDGGGGKGGGGRGSEGQGSKQSADGRFDEDDDKGQDSNKNGGSQSSNQKGEGNRDQGEPRPDGESEKGRPSPQDQQPKKQSSSDENSATSTTQTSTSSSSSASSVPEVQPTDPPPPPPPEVTSPSPPLAHQTTASLSSSSSSSTLSTATPSSSASPTSTSSQLSSTTPPTTPPAQATSALTPSSSLVPSVSSQQTQLTTPSPSVPEAAEFGPSDSSFTTPIVTSVPAPQPSISQGAVAGIAVGSISAVAILVALIFLLRRLRKRGSSSQPGSTRTSFIDKDMRESMLREAAPVAGRFDDDTGVSNRAGALPETTSPKRGAVAGAAAALGASLGGIFGKRKVGRGDPGYGEDVFAATSPIYAGDDPDDVPRQTPEGVASPPHAFRGWKAGQEDLAQQTQPAGSVNCPVQKLQNQFRLHNSSDPRPKSRSPKAVADRDSVSSMSSCSTASRFTFGLDMFRFWDFGSSDSGRSSGWSTWFKQDEGTKAKPSDLASQEKQ